MQVLRRPVEPAEGKLTHRGFHYFTIKKGNGPQSKNRHPDKLWRCNETDM